MAYLEIETPDGTHRVNLERDRLTIGRLSYNDVVLPYAQISRQHAELRLAGGLWRIADLHSTNGIQVNSQRVLEYTLTSGDQIVLAPGISVRFMANTNLAGDSGPAWAGRIRQQQAAQPGGAAPFSMTQPTRPTLGSDPVVPPDSLAALRPRSPFSDDEVPYIPPAMQPPAPSSSHPVLPVYPTGTPSSPVQRSSDIREKPFAPPSSGMPRSPSVPVGSGSNGAPSGFSPAGNGNGSGGYPAPPGPLRAGADPHDPFLREGPIDERQRATSGPAPVLLHVCQTCGQRTAPDSVYCQSCHHSIAQECPNCRLSLLPIQERCPRCHTPNQLSVRRTHPGRTGF